jgi:hypothetical protein
VVSVAEPVRLAAFLARADVAGRALDELSLTELRELTLAPELGWEVLREQSDQPAAVELFSFRLQQLLMAGEIERALDEIDPDCVREDMPARPNLEHALMAVFLAVAWRGGPRVDELFRLIMGEREGPAVSRFGRIRALAPAWQAIEQCPAPLVRFVELFPSVSDALRRELAGELRAALAGERAQLAAALDRMQLVDDRLLPLIDELTGELSGGEELAIQDLPERERDYIARALERFVSPRPPRRWRRVAWGGAIAALATLAIGGYIGLLAGTGVLLVVLVNEALTGLGQVMHATRERIADAVIETGLPPDRILEWATQRAQVGPEPNNPLGFDAGFAHDRALHILGRLSRVCLRWSPPSVAAID